MPTLRNVVVLDGPRLEPRWCSRFSWAADQVTEMDCGASAGELADGALVVIPGLYNAHTHLGDSAFPDAASEMTLEEAFFRPDGYKYRELAKLDSATHRHHVEAHLRYLARTGAVCHIDFREQGVRGAQLLREASHSVGVESIILSQLNTSPFTAAELAANQAPLPPHAREELDAILAVADGFSESTMNDLTEPAWAEVRQITEAKQKWRAIHCLESPAYRSISEQRTGRGDLARALEHLDPHLIVHLTVARPDEIGLLARSGKTAVLNPRANATLGLPLPPLAALLAAGVNLLLGTDNGMLNAPSMWAELDFTYRLAKSQFADAVHPAPTSILAMATSNVRSALGADHYGYLERGLPASFVVLDFTAGHLRHSRHLLASIIGRVTPAEILATYRRGQPLWLAPGFDPSSL